MIKEKVHELIVENIGPLNEWYAKRSADLKIPFYSSYDIRDSGHKIATVDANIFPAGFNNICQVDKESAPKVISRYWGLEGKENVLLLTEKHTSNLYYWDNVATLESLISESGRKVRIAIPLDDFTRQNIESASGKTVEVFPFGDLEGFVPDIVVSNNDFTEEIDGGGYSFNPPIQYGWHRRRKHSYFTHYNELACEFAEILKMDREHFTIRTKKFDDFDISSDESKEILAERVDDFIAEVAGEYQRLNWDQEPFVFLKNNSGTYGLGVLPVAKGAEVSAMSYKARKKMKAAKGGGGFDEIIVQEGIPSIVSFEEGSAEPTIYLVGTELVGGFLRTHKKKGARENLNSPGAVYERLCVSDLKINVENCPLENVYGWLAKIGALAIGREAQDVGAVF